MEMLLIVLIIIACVLLSAVVLVQNPKGGGLASGLSSANQLGGVKQTANFLEKATWYLAIAIVVLTIFTAAYNTPVAGTGPEIQADENLLNAPTTEQPAVPGAE